MVESQVLYLGRWVSREHFRAFVYKNDEQKLAKSYDEFSQLISSGLWSAERMDALIDKPIVAAKAEEKEESNIVEIEPKKRGRPCQNQLKV